MKLSTNDKKKFLLDKFLSKNILIGKMKEEKRSLEIKKDRVLNAVNSWYDAPIQNNESSNKENKQENKDQHDKNDHIDKQKSPRKDNNTNKDESNKDKLSPFSDNKIEEIHPNNENNNNIDKLNKETIEKISSSKSSQKSPKRVMINENLIDKPHNKLVTDNIKRHSVNTNSRASDYKTEEYNSVSDESDEDGDDKMQNFVVFDAVNQSESQNIIKEIILKNYNVDTKNFKIVSFD
eukprot:TRINITY_DN3560_c0_g1_i2.p1 TRINITY_DN3560_c0_g1~~TRINITY_DN3560_c0_g1_i2.p1  ORF type:complete len:236 (-),score=83.55 TRINITY_DN3560_c0_g1_i2:34-741(-)